jgi:hypothetical protein
MDNQFICKNCSYSLTIKKTSDAKAKVISIDKADTLIEYFDRRDEQHQLDIKIELAELEKYLTTSANKKKYTDKKAVIEFFNKHLQKNFTKYNLVCTTCGTEYLLNPETTIYSLNFKKQQNSFNDEFDELLSLKLYDPTLPRTKDYICPHANCESNKANFDSSLKEAVFYRASGSYHMKYACSVCKGKPWEL